MDKIIDKKCPGDDPTSKAVPETFTCPDCGADVEIWTDEKKGKCPSCKSIVLKDNIKK
jgi:DNA-directed RNA polymerase subunit RPC12/RpoP